MKKWTFAVFCLCTFLFAEEPADSATTENVPAAEQVSLAPAETCPSDSILSANYAKCQQALSVAIHSQMDRKISKDRSFEMAATTGSFIGGALIGLLLGWWLL